MKAGTMNTLVRSMTNDDLSQSVADKAQLPKLNIFFFWGGEVFDNCSDLQYCPFGIYKPVLFNTYKFVRKWQVEGGAGRARNK